MVKCAILQKRLGEMANAMLEKLRFSKMFFSSNAVNKGAVMTSTLDEAYTQQLALSNSIEKYLLIDHTKVGKRRFYIILSVKRIDCSGHGL